jgi:hypothetical protein
MLILGFQLVVRVLALNMFLESGYYIDIVFIIRKIIRNTFLRYLKVYA